MRLTLVLLIISLLKVQAETYSQNTKISLKMESVEVMKVLEKIESLTEFKFLGNENVLDKNRKVSLDVENQRVNKILNSLFKNTNITYKVIDRQIVLKKNAQKKNSSIIKKEEAIKEQEPIKIEGVIRDRNGQPLPGASILEKGTLNGAQTDFDGNFSLSVANSNAVLVISYIGFVTKEVGVGDQTKISVSLNESENSLDEVVIVAYGTTTKRKMVSSVATVDTKEISEAPYSSVIQGLSGRVAGLFTRENGGEYGSLPSISIRGAGEPTYVIDGIIASKQEFANLPPTDIDKVSFLKDAAAAAVYGFNSANGIVLITTKKGSGGKLKMTYSNNISFQKATLLPEYLSGYEKALLNNQAAFNDGLPQIIDDNLLNIFKNNLDPVQYPNNMNPIEEATKDFSIMQRHSLSMNGSLDKTKVYLSMDYFGQEGIYVNNDHGLNRYSLRSNISHEFEDIGLTMDANISLSKKTSSAPPIGGNTVFFYIRNYTPGIPYYNPDGNYYGTQNPLANASSDAGYFESETNLVNSRLDFTWAVPGVEGLKIKVRGNYRFIHDLATTWSANQRNSAPLYSWDNELVEMGPASLSQSTGRSLQYDLEGHIYYTKTIADKHTVELTGVYSQGEQNWEGFGASRRNYVSSAVDELFAGSPVGKDNYGNSSKSTRVGYVGRLKYDFDTKYIVEANFRYDGNDNFPSGNRFGFFPSISAGWNIDNEEFIKPVLRKLSMNSLKVRASWGILGSTAGVGRFAYIPGYNLVGNQYYINGNYVTGFTEGNLVSNDLTWFENETTNIGLDFGFMEGKLSGSVDWFYNRTTGYIGSPSDSYTTPLGKDLPQINTDSAHRRGGIDGSLNYDSKIGDVRLIVGGNISYYDQLWEKRYDEEESSLKNPYSRLTGQTDYYTRGYVSEGLYQNMSEILNSPRPLASGETKPGDIKYQDFNGDGRIDGDDFQRIGKSDFPHITYGLNLGALYKGFSFSTLFQGTSNRQVYLGYSWRNELNQKVYVNQSDSWSLDNTGSQFPRTSTFNNVNGGNNTVTSSYWLKDAWYLRMKSAKLSYDFKYKLLKDSVFDNFTVLVSATNLFTISPLNKYNIDPESNSSDNRGYPVQKTFNLGLSVGF